MNPTSIVYITIFVLSAFSCSGNADFISESYSLPDEATLEVREKFRMNGPVRDVYFTSIWNIHVLSDGNLIVQNSPDSRLYELSPEGELVNFIGREGRGPGEFTEVYSSLLTPNDSLHVFEISSARQQVFVKNRENEWEYHRERAFRLELQEELQAPLPEEILPGPDHIQFGVFRIDRNLLALGATLRDTLNTIYAYTATVDANMEQVSPVSRLRPVKELAIYQSGSMTGNSNDERLPGAFYLYDSSTGDVIYIKNRSNEIVSIDSSGSESVNGYLPYDRFPANAEEIGQSVEQMEDRVPGMGTFLRSRLLVHEPYYRNVIYSEETLWVELARSDRNKPNWIITSLSGEILESFHGPTGLFMPTVHGNSLYGAFLDRNDEMYLAGYEVTGSFQ